ncbi:MAG: alpha-ketoacid dehydrogenase subunit beta [Candidatus Diapherotrites archaeon]|uniref:Alpha-ketoacid dehydrogenase subunit beta n=1 Tax=Candidatus Iainarchaeum sp. TaxID=3101447 RepID=A0A8T4L8Z7_9ARCH|nr:alpha-ketoacid dehydrogenase subunit beta [Candidatus Diapherotrites archaeon]
MTLMNMIQALNAGLFGAMQADDSVLVLGEDVGLNGGVFRVTEGLQKKFGPDRVIDTPLAESAIVGASIGLAIKGFRPVAEIQFSGFAYSAFEQLVSHAARIRNRSRGKFSCPLVVRSPCSGGVRALEHHSESMEALFCHVPGLKVVMPSTPSDAKGLLASAIIDPDPVLFFEPLKLYRLKKEEVSEDHYEIPIGKARLVRPGKHVTVVSYGSMVPECEKAALALSEKGIETEVLDLRSLSPLDFAAVQESVKHTNRLAIVHEAPYSFGVGAEIAARIAERNVLELDAPVVRIAGLDAPMPLSKLEEAYLPNANRIAFEIEKLMNF